MACSAAVLAAAAADEASVAEESKEIQTRGHITVEQGAFSL